MNKNITEKDLNPIEIKNKENAKSYNVLFDYVDNVEKLISDSKAPEGFFKKIKYNSNKNKGLLAIKTIRNKISQLKKREEISKDSAVIKNFQTLIELKSIFSPTGIKQRFQKYENDCKQMMVFMELRNGKFTHFLIKLEHPYFDFEDGRYVIDDEYKYYDVASQIYCLDYHQDCSIPIKRKFHMNDIFESLQNGSACEIETSINPVSFKIFMESDIIQKVMKGAEMEQWINFVKMVLLIILIVCIIIACGVGFIVYKIARAKL